MATAFLAPDPVQSTFFLPGGNTPGNGVQVSFFINKSSTPVTVYKDPAASVAWTNPIVLDSGGNLPLGGEVWIPQGVIVTVKWAPANDTFPPVSPYRTMDDLSGINDVSATVSEWQSGPIPTFVSATVFTVSGDQTLVFTNQRRIQTTNTGGTVYSTIVNASFGGGITTVTISNDFPGVMDSGLSAVFYSLLDPSHPSISADLVNRKGNSVVSATTTNIFSTNGNEVHVTASNPIANFGTSGYPGNSRLVIFDGTPVVTAGVNLQIQGVSNSSGVQVSSGEKWLVVADTTSQMLAARFPNSVNTLPPDYISGYTLTNNTVSTYTIGTGAATDSTNLVNIYQTSAVNKSQSSYSFGTNLGGKLHAAVMSSASWYYWFELYRDSDGAGDPGFDISLTPTLPTGVTKYRYIGSRKTNATSTSWETFIQHGDEVQWSTPPALDVNGSISTGARALTTMNVPPGIRVKWFGNAQQTNPGVTDTGLFFTDPACADVAVGIQASPLGSIVITASIAGTFRLGNQVVCWTNTSSQVGIQAKTAATAYVQTLGWTDSRGKPS